MKLKKISQYKIDSNGNLSFSGAMSPMLGAQEFVKNMFDKNNLHITQLYRVFWEDPKICTTWDGADIYPVMADVLAIELNFKYVAVIADLGDKIIPVILDFRDGDPQISKSYLQFKWIKKANEEELQEICNAVATQFNTSKEEFLTIKNR